MTREAMTAAIDWKIRLKQGSAEDWRGFTDWLEANPAHLAAWDAIEQLDADLDALPKRTARPVLAAQPTPARAPSGRRWAWGGGIAAALTAVVSVALLQSPDLQTIETAPGERRQIALADGSRIDLNGGTRIAIDRDNPRFARLEQGQALFTVRHDAARPFEVRAGDDVLQDLGTVFDVVVDKGATRVAVAEGAVLYNPAGERVRLDPGMALREAGDEILVASVAADSVAGWRDGRLSYSAAPIAQVAMDLSRNLGVPVSVEPAIAAKPFTGLIVLDPNRELLFERLAALLGVRAVRSGGGWALIKGDDR